MKSHEILTLLKVQLCEDDIIISSNGNLSREVFHILPQPQIYLRGAMGLPVAVGLGVAFSTPNRRVIVICGDGNFLMGLSSVITAAYYKPSNLKILILDNNSYYTTGGQSTTSSSIDFLKLFESLHVETSKSKIATISTINGDLSTLFNDPAFSLLHLRIEASKQNVVNIPWHPEVITQKFLTKHEKSSE